MVRLVARQFLAHPLRVGLAPAPLDIADDAFEGLPGLVGAQAVVIDESDLVIAGAEQDGVARLLRQVLPRRGHRELVMLGQRFERLGVIGRGIAGLGPGQDGALAQRQRLIGHDEIGLESELGAETVAFGAGAEGIVEREQPRLDLLDGEAGDRAGELLREDHALMRLVLRLVGALLGGLGGGQGLVGELGDGDAVGELERRLETVGEAVAEIVLAPRCGRPPRRYRA